MILRNLAAAATFGLFTIASALAAVVDFDGFSGEAASLSSGVGGANVRANAVTIASRDPLTNSQIDIQLRGGGNVMLTGDGGQGVGIRA